MTQHWAIGFSILEISKFVMQSLFYNKIQKKLGVDNIDVIMSDTDSFLLKVRAEDESKVLSELKDVMDFSNLDVDHPLYDARRKKVPGFLKSEVPRHSIQEVVALRSKTYAFRTDAGEEAKAKGVTRAAKRRIAVEDYRNCLKKLQDFEVVQTTLRSVNHNNQLLKSRKIAFSSFDDKRYLLCPIHSTPYGSVYARRSQILNRRLAAQGKSTVNLWKEEEGEGRNLRRKLKSCFFCKRTKN